MTAKNLTAYSSLSRDKILSELSAKQLDRLFKGINRLSIIAGDSPQWFVISQTRSQIVYWMRVKAGYTVVMPWFKNKLNTVKL